MFARSVRRLWTTFQEFFGPFWLLFHCQCLEPLLKMLAWYCFCPWIASILHGMSYWNILEFWEYELRILYGQYMGSYKNTEFLFSMQFRLFCFELSWQMFYPEISWCPPSFLGFKHSKCASFNNCDRQFQSDCSKCSWTDPGIACLHASCMQRPIIWNHCTIGRLCPKRLIWAEISIDSWWVWWCHRWRLSLEFYFDWYRRYIFYPDSPSWCQRPSSRVDNAVWSTAFYHCSRTYAVFFRRWHCRHVAGQCMDAVKPDAIAAFF